MNNTLRSKKDRATALGSGSFSCLNFFVFALANGGLLAEVASFHSSFSTYYLLAVVLEQTAAENSARSQMKHQKANRFKDELVNMWSVEHLKSQILSSGQDIDQRQSQKQSEYWK